MIIKTQEELEKICAELSEKPYLTIDTEFLRDKTFYSRLCLIQLAGPDTDAVAIDPIEFDLDLTPFHALMENENVIKVFHAARQDLEIFYQMTGKIPAPLFDTQVAAMVCGYGDSIAYNKLVADITGKALAKNAQFTDWSRRPLSEKQLTYALDDVIYLREVYEVLKKRLEKQKRDHWVKQEMEILTSPDTYKMPVDEAWKRIKIRSDKPQVLAILKELATWREELARKKDIPRGRILKDEALADIAVYMPKDIEGLLRIRNVPKDVSKSQTGKTLLKLVAQAKQSPKESWPKVARKAHFPKEAVPTLEMLKLLLKINASEADVAAKLVASASDLEDIATEDNPDNNVMKGWRYEVFGQEAMALKEGKLFLGIKNGRIFKNAA
jgi:ribonuclease D